MKLSDAIATGRTLVNFHPDSWCTCAVGMAGAAIGKHEAIDEWGWRGVLEDFPFLGQELPFPEMAVNRRGMRVWDDTFGEENVGKLKPVWFIVSGLAWAVKEGRITLDQLIDWIAANEPAEPAQAEKQFAQAEADWLERPVGG